MKKILLGSIILGTIGVFAQEVSCVKFASMSESEASRYITQFKNEITVIGNDNNEDTKNIVRENYLKNNSKVSHRHKCLLFREAYNTPVTDLKRIKALSHLSKERLNSSENRLYTQLITQNKQHMKGLKGASLVQADLCVYPLLYLSSEMTNRGLLVYEKRLVGKKMKTFHAYIDRKKVQLACGSRADIGNRYLNYLNQQGANLPLISVKNDIYHPSFSSSKNIKKIPTNSRLFEVISDFNAVNFELGNERIFKAGIHLIYDKSTDNETFFSHNGVKYRATKSIFNRSIKK